MNVIDTRVINVRKKRLVKRSRIDSSTNVSTRSSTINSTFVPDELIYMILISLPADVLYNVMRYTCRQWYNIIHSPVFISSHLKNSNSTAICLFMSDYVARFPKYSIKTRYSFKVKSDHLEVKEENFKCVVGNVSGSCNGLVFVLGRYVQPNRGWPCYVANLVTKEQLHLPLFPYRLDDSNWGFAYAAASRVYKVVYPTLDRLLILTVGVDKAWRKIDCSHLNHLSMNHMWGSLYSPVSRRGFVYWYYGILRCILCFDIENETLRQIPLPPQHPHLLPFSDGVMAMETSICLWHKEGSDLFEFWSLKDKDQWEKGASIDLTGHRGVIEKMFRKTDKRYNFRPLGWLQSGKLLAFGVFPRIPGILVHNVNTGEIHQPEEIKNIPELSSSYDCYDHVDSLVPLNNLSLVTNGRPPKPFRCRAKVYSKDK